MDKVNFLGSVRIYAHTDTYIVFGFWEWDGERWHCNTVLYDDCICEFVHKIK